MSATATNVVAFPYRLSRATEARERDSWAADQASLQRICSRYPEPHVEPWPLWVRASIWGAGYAVCWGSFVAACWSVL